MRSFFLLIGLMMATVPSALVGAATSSSAPPVGPPLADAPVSHDMCTAPAGWVKPFTRVYRLRNSAVVVFVGVEHTDDLADATHREIKAAFDRYKPGFVLVEGTSSAKSVFDWYREDVAGLALQRSEAGHASENLYAVRLATAADTRFSGWDFSPDQDYRVLVEDGFAMDDALGAHLLRAHVDPFDGTTAAGQVARQLRYAAMVRPIAAFDYAGWYRKTYGTRFDANAGTPCGHGIASRIVSDLSYRRNLNLTDLIERYAQPRQTLLVEAGANHWLALKDWLSSRSTGPE